MEGGYPLNNYSINYPGRVKQPKNMNSFSELYLTGLGEDDTVLGLGGRLFISEVFCFLDAP